MSIRAKTTILALDIATSTGWAFWDTTRDEASIKNGSFNVGKGIPKKLPNGKDMPKFQRRKLMRKNLLTHLEELHEQFQPEVVCLELPIGQILDNSNRGKKTKFFGENDGEDVGGGANASTVVTLNQLYGAVDMFFRAKGVSFFLEVPSTTWQKQTSSMRGADTKERAIAYCEARGIPITGTNKVARGDAADATVIAIWASTRCDELKLQKLADEQRNDRSAAA